jgi:putative MATE family efflux protein
LEDKKLFSNKQLLALLWPILIEQFLAILMGIVDTIMVSSIGENAVSAVSLVDTFQILLNGLFAALATGGAVVAANYIGAKNTAMISKTAKQLIYVVVALSVFLMLLFMPIQGAILQGVFGDLDPQVKSGAHIYFFYLILSLPAMALYNGAAALFRAQENSAIPMWIAALVNVLNVGGNAILIFGFHLGVQGAAISTLVARVVAAVVLIRLLYKSKPYKDNPAFDIHGIVYKAELDWNLIKHILAIGIPNGLENSTFQIGKILVMTLIAVFGTAAMAANAVAGSLCGFVVLPGQAIGMGMLTVLGQCMGAQRSDEAEYYGKKLLGWSYVGILFTAIPSLLFSHQLIGIYNLGSEASAIGYKMIFSYCVVAMLIWPPSFALPNALRAVNRAKFTMGVSMISMWIVRVGLSYILCLSTNIGVFGAWVAMYCDWITRGIPFLIEFKRGTWKKNK